MALLLVYLFSALAVSFVCSILEATLMSTPLSYITMREEEGYKPAVRMKQFKQDPGRALAAILSLNTIANTIGAAGVGRQTVELFGSGMFGVVSGITTVLILVFAEIIPKNIGTNNCRSLMGFASTTIAFLIKILYPIVLLVEYIQKAIAPKNSDDNSTISREEIVAMADVAEESGELEEFENDVIQNIINIDEMTVEEVMTPRVVCAIAKDTTTIKSFCRDKHLTHYSRIPIYADNDEYITGYVLRMDALQLMAEDKFDTTIDTISRTIECFPEDTPLNDALNKMIKEKEQIGLVINEYGSFQGIITIEDIVETILGNEIVDERDVVVDMQQLAKERWNRRQTVARSINSKQSK